MKKKVLFLTIFFVFMSISLCSAYNLLADRRWQYVTNTTTNAQVYCDTQSLSRFENGLKAWVCYYTPNTNPKRRATIWLIMASCIPIDHIAAIQTARPMETVSTFKQLCPIF